ncbi:TIGR03943 family putative permease subunit [Gandjariella thermophila]|uniref:TIGR03943 family protein n=1 Tax=Gandjariella thermophila TaxID=1931992 RepID=A0A4D4J8Q9_9PSEU|nr:TIGR03943 family protein [Gandjariella thermophila]GDY31400.1 TIGR03943 family protein [Gandjariella thermophila]
MRRETQNIVLVLLGGALLKIAVNGTYLRYVKPALQPWLIAAGTVMLVLAAVAIGRDIRTARRAGGAVPAEAGHGHHDHGVHGGNAHLGRPPRSPWLLLLPVMAIFLVSPPALGADTVNRAAPRPPAAGDPAKSTAFPPLPAGDVVPMKITDFVTRSAWDGTNALDNRAVRLTGFVVRDPAGAAYLARLVITCCAADAWPVKARLAGVDTAVLRNDEWVDVVGTLVPGSATQGNQYVPTLTATDVHPVPAPADPYEY